MDNPINPKAAASPDTKAPIALGFAVVALWIAAVISALAVVYTTHNVRVSTNSLAQAKAESSELQLQWGQYLLERSTWASYSRIEKIAAGELEMALPEPEEIIVVQQ
ncbi:cell division protein FtsL [Sessilibacter corallicola]|uniref:Cell division protein FtsL n=1 Tax=Sessilibacter corallicola TaxID=2904075 RepID=A0ABQ0A3N8_9GAMM